MRGRMQMNNDGLQLNKPRKPTHYSDSYAVEISRTRSCQNSCVQLKQRPALKPLNLRRPKRRFCWRARKH